jgi:agmatine deiminase
MTWRMPAEWHPHECTWMGWPAKDYEDDPTENDRAFAAWSAVANAIVRFEPVKMLIEPQDIETAKKFLDKRVELVEASFDDGWLRDTGPSFVKNEAGEVAGVNWIFNGWGATSWAIWAKDQHAATQINQFAGVQSIDSKLINEGGGIHVDGEGNLLLTETVQLGEGRNSTWSRQEVEAELHAKLGTKRAIWIRRGLTRDYDEFGTRGHIDIVACFAPGNTILFHDQQDETHPDFSVSHEVKRTLEEAGDFKLIAVPAPKTLKDTHGWVDYSYINHYLVNGGVILCAFEDENDAQAKEILERCYPDREVVLVDARPIFARGGGIHCITQQQPK